MADLKDYLGNKGFKAGAFSEFFIIKVVYTNAETNGMTQFLLDYPEIYPYRFGF